MYVAAEPIEQQKPIYPNNWEALAHLEQERGRLMAECVGLGVAVTASAIFPPAVLATAPAMGSSLQKLSKTSQIYLSMEPLLDEFESQGVIITPQIQVPEYGMLDLLVRFPIPPKKVNFAIALRTKGNSKIVYNEEKEGLYIRRRGGGLVRWQPDHLKSLVSQEFWLRSNQIELFGESSKDRRRPLIKLLVLTGDAKLGQHSEHLYAMIGDQKVLLLRGRSSTYVMEEHQLIPFMHAWLAQIAV